MSGRSFHFRFFSPTDHRSARAFGGAYLRNSHAKTRRPISSKTPMHLVMRSRLARGRHSLLFYERAVQKIIARQARRFGVRVYRLRNAGNHLHLLILPPSRKSFQGFSRAITGLIVRRVLGAEKASAVFQKGSRFWDQRPFSRLLHWGREYKIVADYLVEESVQAMGFFPQRLRPG